MFRILSIDDEPANQKLIQKALEKDYQVELADSGQSGLQIIEENMPDLVLLDVNMPGINGLDTCKQIRELAEVEELPVIFVSALSTLEHKLGGYEAGANDYIAKPIMLPELVSKIKLLLEQRAKYQSIRSNLDSTRQAMFSALNYAGELGSLIQFFEGSFACENLEGLADVIFAAGEQLGLSISLQFRVKGVDFNYSSNKVVSPLEAELLSQAKYGERIIGYGNKSLYNAECLTILVKNMPLEDEEMCGRIRDHLAIILRACESQLELLLVREEVKATRNQSIDMLSRKIAEDFDALCEMVDQYQRRVETIYDEFKLDFEEAAIMCDIDKTQLQTLMQSFERLQETHRSARVQKEAIEDIIVDITSSIATIKE